jgi:hypothetical protein
MSYGKHTYGVPIILWQNNDAKLVVGNFCSIANNVNIYLQTICLSCWKFFRLHKLRKLVHCKS